MGYRHYFFITKKEDVDKVKDLTLDEIKQKFSDDDGYISLDNVIEHQEIFEFGKLYYEDTDEQIYNTGNQLFNDKEVMEYYGDYIPYVVGKDGVLKAIEIYANKVKEYYKGLLVDGEEKIIPIFGFTINDEDIKSIDKIKKEIQSKIRMWEHFKVCIQSDSEYNVTSSWLYEYSIFNLIHILKTVDWENETILFYGY